MLDNARIEQNRDQVQFEKHLNAAERIINANSIWNIYRK
jgi:hypothetical protein